MKPTISADNIKLYNSLVDGFTYRCNSGEILIDYLKRLLEHYNAHIQRLDGYIRLRVLERADILTCLPFRIFETASNYLLGNTPSAYASMNEAFSCIEGVLERKSNRYKNENISLPLKFAFKGRRDDPAKPFPKTREEMFHIKFEDRSKIKDYRYSIRGMPSLYLGNSLYDCWIELDQPPLEDLCFSLFCFSDIDFIDLTFSYNHAAYYAVGSVLKGDDWQILQCEKLIDDFLLWPLIAACSLKYDNTNASFKQEYIIPQMLYQLCVENTDFCGVRYHSTKLTKHNRKEYQGFMVNYALPAQDVKRSGYCPSLAGKLSLTEPIKAVMCEDIQGCSYSGYFTATGCQF